MAVVQEPQLHLSAGPQTPLNPITSPRAHPVPATVQVPPLAKTTQQMQVERQPPRNSKSAAVQSPKTTTKSSQLSRILSEPQCQPSHLSGPLQVEEDRLAAEDELRAEVERGAEPDEAGEWPSGLWRPWRALEGCLRARAVRELEEGQFRRCLRLTMMKESRIQTSKASRMTKMIITREETKKRAA